MRLHCALLLAGCAATVEATSHDAARGTESDAAADVVDVSHTAPPIASSLRPPRLIAPLSGARVTQLRPRLRWSTAHDDARIEVCADRACARVLVAWVGAERPPVDLSPGIHFWRVRDEAGASAVWSFIVPRVHDPQADTSWPGVSDIDLDGRADVILIEPVPFVGRSAIVYRAWRDGLPTDAVRLLEGSVARATIVGDLDGDGYGEVAVQRQCEDGTRTIRFAEIVSEAARNDNDRSLRTRDERCATIPPVVPLGDVDADGYADIAVELLGEACPVERWRCFGVYRGGSSLTDTTPVVLSGTGATLIGVPAALGDVNGDGFADIALQEAPGLHWGDARPGDALAIRVYLGDASGAMARSLTLRSGSAGDTRFGRFIVGPADVNGDGFADVVSATAVPEADSALTWTLHVFPGGAAFASGPPAQAIELPIAFNGGTIAVVAAADMDGDGCDDVAAYSGTGYAHRIAWRRGGVDGLTSSARWEGALDAEGMYSMVLRDLDGDGRADRVSAHARPFPNSPSEWHVEVAITAAWPPRTDGLRWVTTSESPPALLP